MKKTNIYKLLIWGVYIISSVILILLIMLFGLIYDLKKENRELKQTLNVQEIVVGKLVEETIAESATENIEINLLDKKNVKGMNLLDFYGHDSMINEKFDMVKENRETTIESEDVNESESEEVTSTEFIEALAEEMITSAPILETSSEVLMMVHINGDDNYNGLLYEALKARGIEWWMSNALCQMCQESHFNPYATHNRSDGGVDCGLFQFSLNHWDYAYGDIWDPMAQINRYCDLVANRINSGKDECTIISDHFTGGSGYNAQYVSDVLSHRGELYWK